MRAKFSRDIEYIPNFEENATAQPGDQVKFKLRPLGVGDFHRASEAISAMGLDVQDNKIVGVGNPNAVRDFLLMAPDFFATYIESVGAPILPSQGEDPYTLRDIATMAPFMSLATELLWMLVGISAPSQADVKN